MDIEQGNKLIAEFMGFVRKAGALEHYSVPKGQDLHYKAFTLDLKKMTYHTSWDWLMPVVEKIQSLDYFVSILGDGKLPNTKELPVNYCNIFKSGFTTEILIDGGLIPSKSKIESVWKSIVQFIQWYNQDGKIKTNPA